MSDDRTFVVDIEPGWGDWKVWVSEEPYRGAITDGDLPGERQKLGGGWTSRHLVGSAKTERGARRKGRKALAKAEFNARIRRTEGKARVAFYEQNKPIRITTSPTERHDHE